MAIDLHKRRSLIVRADEQGERLETIRIENEPINLALLGNRFARIDI